MNLLTPPTDNLYKFIAIFGLVICISSLFILSSSIDKLSENISSTIIEAGVVQKRAELIEKEVDRLNLSGVEITSAQIEEIFNKLEPIELANARLDSQTKVNSYSTEFLIKQSENYKTVGFFGFLLSIFGFFLWYIKLQRYIDLSVKKESKK